MSKVYNPRLTAVKSILTAALDRIEMGWVKHTSRRTDPKTGSISYCASGAIQSVSRSTDYGYRATKALAKARRVENVMLWNDRPRTTKSDVVAAFKKAIAQA